MKIKYLILLVLIFTLTSCAKNVYVECEFPTWIYVYGFWGGLWHGIILPFSWLGSLFSNDISIYAYSNNGNWYTLGFAIGCGAVGQFVRMFNTSK